MTSAIASQLQELLVALIGATDDSDQVCGPSEPGQALGLDGELEVFIFHLEHVLGLIDAVHLPPTSAGAALHKVHDEAVSVRTMTAADAALSAAGYDLLGRRIRNGAEALRAVAVPLVATARLALASLYPPAVAADLTQQAFTIMKAYAAAVTEAWAAGIPANSAKLTATDELLQRFPTDVLVGYFHGGLDATIASIKGQRETLKVLYAQPPGPNVLPSYADVNIDVEANGQWVAGLFLDQEWGDLHSLFSLRPDMPPTKEAQQKLAAFLRKLQAYQVTLTGLIVYRELEILVDKLTFPTNLTQDQTDLAAALDDVHSGFLYGPTFAKGAAKMADLIGGQTFHDDIDSALWRLEVTAEIKAGITMVALSAVLLTAATLTAGVAAGAAGAAIAELTTGLVAGAQAWTAIGAFATEVLVFTLVDRTGKVLLFGPDSIADTSFGGDLFWNAVTFGVMRVVHLGFGACFSEATRATFAFWLVRFSVDQLALYGIGRIRSAMDDPKQAGRFPPREQSAAREIINQVVVGLVMELGGMLREPVRPRLGNLAPAIEAADLANLDAAEAAAADLGTKLDEVGPTAPTDEVVQDLLTKLANVFNLTRELIMRQPDGTAGRTDALMRLYALRAAVEMRLAKAGALVTLSDGNPPQIAPGGTNVVVAPPEAKGPINQVLTDQGAPPLTDLPTVEGGAKSVTDDGQITVVVSADALTGPPPPPEALADLAFLTDLLGTKDSGDPLTLQDVSPMAAGGLLNLAADRPGGIGPRSQAAIRRIVLEAEPGQRMGYLEFLSRDEFKQPGAFSEMDLTWFARAPGMREFGGAYGIELARDIRSKVDQASARFDRRTLAKVFEVASAEMEATGSDATARAAKLEQMADRTGALWRQLATNGPAFAKAPAPTATDFGIKTSGTLWEAKRAEVENWYSDPKWTAQWDKITLIELVMDRANTTTDYSDKLSAAQRRELLKNFIALGKSAGLVSDINGKFGHLNQRLFRPYANRKMVFFKVEPGKPPPKLNDPGSYKPDDWQETATRYISTEQKANELYDINMSAADMKALARLHRDKISIGLKNAAGKRVGGGFESVPQNMPTDFNIEYTFTPWSADGKKAMIDAFSAFGSKVNQVTFGDEVIKITPRSAPDPNLD